MNLTKNRNVIFLILALALLFVGIYFGAYREKALDAVSPLDISTNVNRASLQAAVSNLSETLVAARGVPYMRDGRPIGFHLLIIRPASIWSEIGLIDGDILTGVDGKPITSPLEVIEVIRKGLDNSRVTLSVERRGSPLTWTFVVVD